MHLTLEGCLNDSGQCLWHWLTKTTTEFHGQPPVELPFSFGAFCWSYALAGWVTLLTRPSSWPTSFPFVTFGVALIVCQAPLSYLADAIYLQEDTMLHVLDRCLAVPGVWLETWRVVCLCRYARTSTAIVYTGLFLLALYSFLQSQRAQSQHNVDDFILWHNRWHL